MSFRPATTDDQHLLYRWRIEAERQGLSGGWWRGVPTTEEGHRKWFLDRLGRVPILIWVEDGVSVAAVRFDTGGELSFAPKAGDATVRMLRAVGSYAAVYGGRLKATLDAGDLAACVSLERAGFREYPARFYALKP